MLGSRLGRGLLVLGCWAAGLLAAPPGLAAPGGLDSSFGRMGEFALQTNPACSDGCPEYIGSNAQALALQSDGKLLIAGRNFDDRAYAKEPSTIVRLSSDGTIDGTFGSGGFAQTPAVEVRRLYANADGSITSVGIKATEGFPDTVGIEHYIASGATDGPVQWFVVPVLAETAQIDSRGRLVALGITTPPLVPDSSEPKIMRFLPTGAPDRSFGEGGVISLQAPPDQTETSPSGPEAFALGKDGSVFVVATTYDAMDFGPGGEPPKAHTILYRFTSKGKPDRSFGQGGMVILPASKGYKSLALAVAPDGDVVLAAGEDIMGSLQQVRLLVVRYTKTGRPDDSFGSGGVAARAWNSISPDLIPSAIAFDARGDTVIAGSSIFAADPGSVGKWFLTRLTDDGFDCSFGSRGMVLGGTGTSANAVAVQTDGRIVIAGKRRQEFAAARYVGGGTPRTCPGEHKSHKPKYRRKRRRHR